MPYRSVNPATGDILKTFTEHTDQEVIDALATADRAFVSWAARPIEERAKIISRAAQLLLERKSELAKLATLEMGKRIAESSGEAYSRIGRSLNPTRFTPLPAVDLAGVTSLAPPRLLAAPASQRIPSTRSNKHSRQLCYKRSHRNRYPHCPADTTASARCQLKLVSEGTLMFSPIPPAVSEKVDKHNEEVHGLKKNDLRGCSKMAVNEKEKR